MQKADYIIRPMKDEDIPQVTEIDHGAFPSEWAFRSSISYRQDLNNPLARYIVAHTEKEVVSTSNRRYTQQLPLFKWLFGPGHSTEEGKHTTEYIIGFAGFWLMLRNVHITAIAVRSNYRRIGIGEGLLISIIELATQLNASVVTLEVRASNEIAQSLYTKYGFRKIGRHLRYYSDNGEDAILMNTDNITSVSFQAYLQQLKLAHAQKYREISTEVP
jgi:ribosomal-protein-alanine acetyltransferase